MATTTALDLITKSLGLLGIGAEGETLTAQQANDALDSLNNFLALLGVRSLLTSAQIQESFPLVANLARYTIGPSVTAPNFIAEMPQKVVSGFIRDDNGNDTFLNIISREEYNSFSLKTDTGTPEYAFYDPGPTQQAAAFGTLNFYLTPDSTIGYQAFLVSEKTFTQFASLGSLINFPAHYYHFLIYNLAPILAPFYGRLVPAEVSFQAEESMRIIETLNSSNKGTVANLGLPSMRTKGNILTGGI